MNRVDLPVQSALHVVGTKRRTRPERLVVAFEMVVLDLQVAVGQQAVRDDQVVRFVAARSDRARVHRAEDQIHGEAAGKDRDACRVHREGVVAPRRIDELGAGEHEWACRARQRDSRDHPSKRAGEDEQQRESIGNPREKREGPQPEQAEPAERAAAQPAEEPQRHPHRAAAPASSADETGSRREEPKAVRAIPRPVDDVNRRRDEPDRHRDGGEPEKRGGSASLP